MMYINHNALNANDLIASQTVAAQFYQTSSNQHSLFNQIGTALPTPTYFQHQSQFSSLHPQHNYHQHPKSHHLTNKNNNGSSFYALTTAQANSNPLYNGQNSLASKTTNSNAQPLQHQQQQRSSSTSSSLSSTSSNSTSPSNSSNQSTIPATIAIQPNNSLANSQMYSKNLYSSLNFAYYNPALACTYSTTQPGSISTTTAGSVTSATSSPTSSQLLSSNSSIINLNSSPNLASSAYTNLYRQKDMNNFDSTPNYQINVLTSSKTTNTNVSNSSNCIASNNLNASIKNNHPQQNGLIQNSADSSLNKILTLNSHQTTSNPLYLLNATPISNKSHQENFLNQTAARYDPTTIAAYLPSTGSDCSTLFFTNPGDHQHNALTAIPASFVTASSFGDLAFSAKNLLQGFNANSGLKPQFSSSGTPISICLKKRKRRFKKPPELRKVLPKNSLMLLHELRPNVEYRFICQSGPIHRPIFTMCVDINEHKFEGNGKTKKEARMAAAEKALQFLMQNPEYIQKSQSNINTTSSEKSSNINANEARDEEDDEEEDNYITDKQSSLVSLQENDENEEDNHDGEVKRQKRDDDEKKIKETIKDCKSESLTDNRV